MTGNVVMFKNTTGLIEVMSALLAGEGLTLCRTDSLEELEALAGGERAPLMLMNMELNENGWGEEMETISYLRRKTAAPIIVVSSQRAEMARIMALNVGADDYVMAGDNPLVLLARVKSQLRRYTQLMENYGKTERVFRVGDLELNDESHVVKVEGRDVKVTPIEYQILRLLMREQGKVFSVYQIYEAIWHMKAVEVDNMIAVHIRHIREKIEANPRKPQYLKVVRGEGYKVG